MPEKTPLVQSCLLYTSCICLMLLIARPALDLVCAAVILVTTVYSGAEYFLSLIHIWTREM